MASTKTPTAWAAVAAAVRRELKARRTELGIPAEATVRVTSGGFAGGASVDVHLSGMDAYVWKVADVHDEPRFAGDKILTARARRLGDAIAAVILAERSKTGASYIWGSVDHDGTTLGSGVTRCGWTPGQD